LAPEFWVDHYIRKMHDAFLKKCAARDRPSGEGGGMGCEERMLIRSQAKAGHYRVPLAVPLTNMPKISLAKGHRRLNKRVEHCLQVECRSADDLEDLGCCGLLPQRLAQLVEQASVLNRNDSLSSEIRDERDLLVRKRTYFLAVDGECTDERLAAIDKKERACSSRWPGGPGRKWVRGADAASDAGKRTSRSALCMATVTGVA
jgi:hypothetical protein